MAGSETLTLWQMVGVPGCFHLHSSTPRFSSLLLDAATVVGALQSTGGDRELGCAEK